MFLVRRVQLLASTLSVVVALAAHAQTGSEPTLVDQLEIRLKRRPDCKGITRVLVVMGDELDPQNAQKDGRDECHWSTERRLDLKYDTGLAVFSLRLDGVKTRTTCKEAKPINGVGYLLFDIAQEESWELYVRTDPKIAVRYLRDVKANPKIKGSVDCLEGGVIDPRFPISKLWWFPEKWEALRLQLDEKHQDPNYPGLVVNHQAVSKHLKDGKTNLGIVEIVDALGKQRLDGTSRTPPGISPPAYEADKKMLLEIDQVKECVKKKQDPTKCLTLTLEKSK